MPSWQKRRFAANEMNKGWAPTRLSQITPCRPVWSNPTWAASSCTPISPTPMNIEDILGQPTSQSEADQQWQEIWLLANAIKKEEPTCTHQQAFDKAIQEFNKGRRARLVKHQ